jgi:hypothetical protein
MPFASQDSKWIPDKYQLPLNTKMSWPGIVQAVAEKVNNPQHFIVQIYIGIPPVRVSPHTATPSRELSLSGIGLPHRSGMG